MPVLTSFITTRSGQFLGEVPEVKTGEQTTNFRTESPCLPYFRSRPALREEGSVRSGLPVFLCKTGEFPRVREGLNFDRLPLVCLCGRSCRCPWLLGLDERPPDLLPVALTPLRYDFSFIEKHHLLGAQVGSLVSELRSCMPRSSAKKKKKKKDKVDTE